MSKLKLTFVAFLLVFLTVSFTVTKPGLSSSAQVTTANQCYGNGYQSCLSHCKTQIVKDCEWCYENCHQTCCFTCQNCNYDWFSWEVDKDEPFPPSCWKSCCRYYREDCWEECNEEAESCVESCHELPLDEQEGCFEECGEEGNWCQEECRDSHKDCLEECHECSKECFGECKCGVCYRIDNECQKICGKCFPIALPYKNDFNKTKGGVLSILVKGSTVCDWTYVARQTNFDDFIAEVDARKTYGSIAIYGIRFREPKKYNRYFFYVMTDGQYALHIMVAKRKSWFLVGRTKSPYINQGNKWNHLKVIAEGTRLKLFVNEKYLTSVNDPHFKEGRISLAACRLSGQSSVKAHFDNLKIESVAD